MTQQLLMTRHRARARLSAWRWMVARKERTLLIEVHSLDAAAAPPSGAIKAELREAVRRSGTETTPATLKAPYYSREARLLVVRTSLALSRAVRVAVGSIRYVKEWPVRLAVVRAYGNQRLARRGLAERLEVAMRQQASDVRAQKALRELLDQLADLQKS